MKDPDAAPPPPPLTQEKSMALLGWDLVRQALASCAAAEMTRRQCLSLLPESSFEAAQERLAETAAMTVLLGPGEGLPIRPFDDLSPIIDEAENRCMIEPGDGLAVLEFLRLVKDLQKRLRAETTPEALRHFTQTLQPLPDLFKELDRCLDPDGGVRDNASPELKEAAREAAGARQALETSVRRLMGSAAWKDSLQDAYFTEREGRAVLPVKAEARTKVDGIVHDSSGSGQTLFIEPTSVVPLNNRLKIARLNVEQEEARVLGRLAQLLAEQRGPLQHNLEAAVAIDLLYASARLGLKMKGSPCELTRTGGIRLLEARNPELVLNGHAVVPNTLTWEDSVRVLIISGPNTGGKTVTLKTVGLMALMARSGLFIPAAENSRLPFFAEVYADIGDDQDIGQNLSTFSAHLHKIIHILHHARPGALVLLDELGIATDPQQGAALAEAILTEMKRRGMTTLVSTHYLVLKTLAQTEPGFLNACTEFDLNTLSPTYRLVFGVPGQSAALETAERLGLDASVLGHARERYARLDTRAESLLEELTRQKQELEREKDTLERLRLETEQTLTQQVQIREALQEQENQLRRNKAQRLQVYLRDAKREIRKLLAEAKTKSAAPDLRQVEKRLHAMHRAEGRVPSAKRAHYTIPADRLRRGDEVMIDGYESIGILEEDPQKKSKLRVRLGNFSTVVAAGRLFGHTRGLRTCQPETPSIQIQTETQRPPTSTCDLRGLNLEEARDAMEVFLSQAVLNKIPRATLIHGHGMGKIKQMVRDYLDATRLGKSFGPASRNEGGDGATIIEF